MAQSKKSSAKSTAKADSDSRQLNTEGQAEARPIGQGKDPLAEGNTLVNPTNTEAETHYDVKERGEDVQAQEAENTINGQDANERAEQHNAQSGNVNDTPDHVEVPNRSEEQLEEDAVDREEAVAEAYETDK